MWREQRALAAAREEAEASMPDFCRMYVFIHDMCVVIHDMCVFIHFMYATYACMYVYFCEFENVSTHIFVILGRHVSAGGGGGQPAGLLGNVYTHAWVLRSFHGSCA